MTSATNKLDALTTTRFIAGLSVVFFHGGRGLYLLNLFPIDPLMRPGFPAVNYFFVLSGFVMAMVYYRPGQKFNFREYFTARFSRVYPLYIFSFAVTCLYYLDILSRIESDKVWANLLLYQAWFPQYATSFNIVSWSLSAEVFFYILFPFLAILSMRLPAKRVIGLSLGFWVFSQLVYPLIALWLGLGARYFLGYFPLFHLNSFLLGIAGGVWYRTEAPKRPHTVAVNLGWMALSLAIISAGLIAREFGLIYAFLLDVGLLSPFFLIFILTLALDRTVVSKALSHPWLVLLGDASYATYMLHILIRWVMEKGVIALGIPITYGQFFAFLYLPVVFIISILIFLFIERPARDWLRYNMHKVPLMLLDLGLVAGSIWVSFFLVIGNADPLPQAQTYALRIGVGVFFVCLLAFRLYVNAAWKWLIPSVALGALVWTGFVYLAARNNWIEAFPRTALALAVVLIFTTLLAARFALRRFAPASLLDGSEKWQTMSDPN